MTKQEKIKIRKARKTIRIVNYATFVLWVGWLIVLIGFIVPHPSYEPTQLIASLLLLSVLIPLFSIAILSSYRLALYNKFNYYRAYLLFKKDKQRVKLIFDLIAKKEYDTVNKYYNFKRFIINNECRLLVDGMLIATTKTVNPQWELDADELFNSIISI